MDETNFKRGLWWRCSACDRLNSLEYDKVYWRCMEVALKQDATKLAEMK